MGVTARGVRLAPKPVAKLKLQRKSAAPRGKKSAPKSRKKSAPSRTPAKNEPEPDGGQGSLF